MLEYSEEQKKSAVSEVVLLNRSIKSVANDFDVTQALLKKWISDYRETVSESYEAIKKEDFESFQKHFHQVVKERDALKHALMIVALDGLNSEI